LLRAADRHQPLDSLTPREPGRRQHRRKRRLHRREGSYVAFSSEPGSTASDGADGADGQHSPFARALSKALEKPGLELDLVFRTVRKAVSKATDGAQRPNTFHDLTSVFHVLTDSGAHPGPIAVVMDPLNPPEGSTVVATWRPGDEAGCKRACAAGSSASCLNHALVLLKTPQTTAAAESLEIACSKGLAPG
jgi:hypothetical protein